MKNYFVHFHALTAVYFSNKIMFLLFTRGGMLLSYLRPCSVTQSFIARYKDLSTLNLSDRKRIQLHIKNEQKLSQNKLWPIVYVT